MEPKDEYENVPHRGCAAQRGNDKMLATLRHIAAIAHSGGLAGLDHVDALCAVRRLTLQYWNSRKNEADGRMTVVDAMHASNEAGK